MRKIDYIETISRSSEDITRKDVNYIVNELFSLMAKDLINGEKITISNFGTFSVSITKPINIYNPQDGSLIKNSIQKRIHFKASDYIKGKR
ncbi:MAG: HU family DNA-binding protein [Bacilli bacterium]